VDDARPRRVGGQQGGDLGQREDEDQVEEQLARRDGLAGPRRARLLDRSDFGYDMQTRVPRSG